MPCVFHASAIPSSSVFVVSRVGWGGWGLYICLPSRHMQEGAAGVSQMSNVVNRGASSPSSRRGVDVANRSQPQRQRRKEQQQPAFSPLYNMTVRSLSESRPLMVCVPLASPNHSEREVKASQDGMYPRVAAQSWHTSDAVSDKNKKGNSNSSGSDTGRCRFIGGGGRNTVQLTSPVPLTPYGASQEERVAGHRREYHTADVASSSPRVALRRSSSALLVSPRPSPSTKKSPHVGLKKKNQEIVPALQSIMLAGEPRVREGNTNAGSSSTSEKGKQREGDEHMTTEGLLHAVPPHHRITSPSQHRLVYDNDDLLLLRQRRLTSSSDGAVRQTLAGVDDDVQLLLSPISSELKPTGAVSRMSPTSLQFSLPLDDRSDFSSEASSAPQIQTSSTDGMRGHSTGNQVSTARRSVAFQLHQNDEGWSSSGERKSKGSSRHAAKGPKPRCNSEPSRPLPLPPPPMSRCMTNNSRRSLASFDPRRSQLIIPQKNEIMREFHELHLQEETLVLIDSEERSRRDIRNAYVVGLRGLLVEHIFRRLMLLPRENERETRRSSSSCSSLEISSARSAPAVAEATGASARESMKAVKVLTQRVGLAPPCGSRSLRKSACRSGKPSNDSGSGKVTLAASSTEAGGSAPPPPPRKKKENPLRNPHKPGPVSRETEVRNTEDLRQTMRRVEVQLLHLLSEEHRQRQHVFSTEAAAFYFLLRYHRIVSTALQRAPIYAQEASQWQSVLTEANNGLQLLQGVRMELGHWGAQTRLQHAVLQLEDESRTYHRNLQQAESYERHQLSRLFRLGLAALLELQACCSRRREQQMQGEEEAILLEEMKEREMLCIEELRCRGVLYRTRESLADALIELSVIAPEGEECSSVTDAPMHAAFHTGVVPTCNVAMATLVRSLNASCAHHAAIVNSTDRSGDAVFTSPSSSCLPVERVFFEWNPTSNTAPLTTTTTTTAATTTNTTTAENMYHDNKNAITGNSTTITGNTASTTTTGMADASAGPHTMLHASPSWRRLGVLQTPSPLPHEVQPNNVVMDISGSLPHPCTTTTRTRTTKTSTNTNTNTSANSVPVGAAMMMMMMQQPNSLQISQIESSVNMSSSGRQTGVERSYELVESVRQTPLFRSVQKPAGHDVGVTACIQTHSSSQDGNERGQIQVVNRHIVPCSLKNHHRHGEKRVSASLMQVGTGRVKQTVSRGTQLTPATPRPYRDDIIFERAPPRRRPKTGGSAGTEEAAATLAADMGSTPALSTSWPSQENTSGQGPNCSGATEMNGGSQGLDNVEEVECINSWMHSITEVEEEEIPKRKKKKKSIEEVSCTDSATASFCSEEARNSGRLASSSSSSVRELESTSKHRRESVTVPEFSVSTMMDATAAGSTRGDTSMGWKGWSGRAVVGATAAVEGGASSIGSSCSDSVSASTGLDAGYTDHHGTDRCAACDAGATPDGFRRLSTAMDWTPSPEHSCSNVSQHHHCYCDPSLFNYMRPTISWRRQHEELEWQTWICPSRRVAGFSVASGTTSQSAGRRRLPKDTTTLQVTRIPLEEGPGVWGDAELPRRPFAYDRLGSRAQAATEAAWKESPAVETLICSPRHRQTAARRFMAEGSVSRCASVSQRSSLCRSNTTGKIAPTGASEEEVLGDRATMAALRGFVERKALPSPGRPATAKSSARHRQREVTPSYVEAFYKLDHKAAGRRCVLASMHHGPVLRPSASRAGGASTPHRQHSQHIQRRQESAAGGNDSHMLFSPDVVSHTYWSPQPSPWRLRKSHTL